ncbi:baseplate assembly protein [Uliginosibacterium gangwonense]|uniref:baseplate assembly protein n=1 Tax=Uliginosibacterium gangwonense TaxID=392736 RepID=UPI0003667F84|nr:baseplate assembly protein [Uliginosibacterium gangwonense]
MSTSTVMATTGMHPETGLSVSGLAHIQMCIGQILNTPQGSCVARREFGSLLPFMIDAPLNPLTRIRVVAAWTRVNNCTAPRVGEAENEGVNDEIDRFEPATFKADHDDWEQYDRAVGFLYPGGGGEYLD